KGGHTEVFNGRDTFDHIAGMTLCGTLLSSVPRVSFDKAVDHEYDPLSKQSSPQLDMSKQGGAKVATDVVLRLMY
ncbi:hypothetical protein BHM03_00052461, partial [Ensete ventricosum]